MKVTSPVIFTIALAVSTISTMDVLLGSLSNPTQAATVDSLPGSPCTAPCNTGIGYEWAVTLGGNDEAELIRHVGAFSWNERNPPVYVDPNQGWTHTSNWVKLDLTQAAQLTLQIDRQADVPNGAGVAGNNLYPAFTIFKGWQTEGSEDHFYDPRGNTDWADQILFYDYKTSKGLDSSITGTFTLPKGTYSIAIGGDPPIDAARVREGYKATLRTVAVPEPTTTGALLITAAGTLVGAFFGRRSHPRD